MDKSIRVKADLNANSANLVVNLSQNFDFLEVLSLRLNSDEVYRLHNSNYGVLVGRVSTNVASVFLMQKYPSLSL